MMEDIQRYMRWLEGMWGLYEMGYEEERRKEEVLGVLRWVAKESERVVEGKEEA